MSFMFGPRRGTYVDISQEMAKADPPPAAKEVAHFEAFDLIYRSLCALLFNYVPTSGHPGGSISVGRPLAGLLFDVMEYDVSDPEREDADMISFAAGHKALGLYAMWALRNEIVRLGAPQLLPEDERQQLRLEDLLGFRRNVITKTPLFLKYRSKALDGHPTPATPFVRLATGASGVGLTTSLGLALGALDTYGDDAPFLHIVEGEGGMTPGRVSEGLAAAGTASIRNVVLHVDWNQASIDSNHVCRDGEVPGEYVQWTPMELAYLHDWNVIYVPDGFDFQQVLAAQRLSVEIDGGQPTAVVYRTTKGWQYGIEGRASHGAGHKLCCQGFYEALKPFVDTTGAVLPSCYASETLPENVEQRCRSGQDPDVLEGCLWDALSLVRGALEADRPLVETLAARLVDARKRLDALRRKPRAGSPTLGSVFETAKREGEPIPEELALHPGQKTTLRDELARVLWYYNKASNGALITAAADLYGSTSVAKIGKDFAEGFYSAATNPRSRLLATGGICEDAMTGILAGLASFGHHIGVGASYGAFSAPLGHVPARLHAIANQARQAIAEGAYRPIVIVCAHAGVKTGEDGPTHADPQALQLFQGNFPDRTMVTLTPWDPQELWPLVSAALNKRPAVIAPFVTRPGETVLDREALGLAPPTDSRAGVYLLLGAEKESQGTLILQGSDVAYAFVEETLPLLRKNGIDIDVYYVSSAELFDQLPRAEQDRIFPESKARDAMGITGFTLPTMYRWVQSEYGRRMTLYPFRHGHFLGSGQADKVIAEAGLDGESQYTAINEYLKGLSAARSQT